MAFISDAWQFPLRCPERLVKRQRQQSWVLAVCFVKQFAFAADEQCTASLVELLLFPEFDWFRWKQPAVVPRHLHSGFVAAGGKFVDGHRCVWVGSAVERSRDCFNRSRKSEIKGPHRNID